MHALEIELSLLQFVAFYRCHLMLYIAHLLIRRQLTIQYNAPGKGFIMELDGILPFVNLVIIEMILSSGKVARLVKKPSVVVGLNHAI